MSCLYIYCIYRNEYIYIYVYIEYMVYAYYYTGIYVRFYIDDAEENGNYNLGFWA